MIFLYSVFGTTVSTIIGRKLVPLNFEQLKKEADFRYGLVRLRENAESIAFYSGENIELGLIKDRLKKVVNNTMEVITASRNLEFFTTR